MTNMECSFLRCAALLISLQFAQLSSATTSLPLDTRTWEQTTADFVATEAQSPFNNEDGPRLKALDPKKALEFLLPFLAKEHPKGLRLKAIGALGACAFKEAIPELSAIAKDPTEDEDLRAGALNPGLRYMKSPQAVEVAVVLAADKSKSIRNSAYWVLSDHGTEIAVKSLETRIQAKDLSLFELRNLIDALLSSQHPQAGRIIFANCDFSVLPSDESLVAAYSRAMDQYSIPEAQQNMLLIARQSGCLISSYYALRYFSSFPSEDAMPALVAFVTGEGPYAHLSLFATVTEFIKSEKITPESRKTLSDLIASGKVKKLESAQGQSIDEN